MTLLAFAENSIKLVPDGTLILHILIILVMVFVLNATLFKPINRILEERERRTRGRSGEAHDILQRVEEKVAHYERTLREARAAGYQLLEQERAAALSERQARLNAVKDEISRSVAEQKEAIHAQVEDARATLEQEARRIAAQIGSQILHRPISETVTRSLELRA
jgi:F-type H+-transporting ATPase subunit b